MDIKSAGNNDKPSVLVIGVVHGDEPQGKFLIENYLKLNPDTKILFIPCLNHYGFENKIRVNKNHVDINRNFPTKNWELSDINDYYSGVAPASEFETRFLINLIENNDFKVILTLHAPYKVVNYDKRNDDDNSCKDLVKKISEIIKYPICDDIGYPTPGSFGTWAGLEKNISTITLELDEDADMSILQGPVFKIFKLLEEY